MNAKLFNQLDRGYAVRFEDARQNKRLMPHEGHEAVITTIDRRAGMATIQFSDGARAFVTREQLEMKS